MLHFHPAEDRAGADVGEDALGVHAPVGVAPLEYAPSLVVLLLAVADVLLAALGADAVGVAGDAAVAPADNRSGDVVEAVLAAADTAAAGVVVPAP